MSRVPFDVLPLAFATTADVPRDDDLFYRCQLCGGIIPSVPVDNIGCTCGNIFIDKDTWRLIVVDLSKLQVVRMRSARGLDDT